MDKDPDILLVYTSIARQAFPQAQLVELMNKARIKNKSMDITGMLLHVEGSFFQVLEGGAALVARLFASIEKDPRHKQVTKLIEEALPLRNFSEWSMGLAEASRMDLITVPGLNDFFSRGSSLNMLEAGRAKTLLQAFRQGQWRRRVSYA